MKHASIFTLTTEPTASSETTVPTYQPPAPLPQDRNHQLNRDHTHALFPCKRVEGKGKFHRKIGHEGPDGESSTFSLTPALDEGRWSTPHAGRLISEKAWFCNRLFLWRQFIKMTCHQRWRPQPAEWSTPASPSSISEGRPLYLHTKALLTRVLITQALILHLTSLTSWFEISWVQSTLTDLLQYLRVLWYFEVHRCQHKIRKKIR
jgi:hypothetical protein